ncbi:hypothetical protein B296_00029052 [Ensete ventricosum]|uniref:Uncharacterized protein n=1 Tax=Ensete ventricosum TaxID=4639 RepID=A0A426YAM7_ENSVE|nr:hypothetical protein B296_00029052 [Ensete ventricosum]
MHRVDAVGNSSGVRRELAKGIRSLSGWRKGVRQKKTETRRKIIGDDRPKLSLGIEPSLDDVVGSRRSSLGDSSKGLRSSLGIRWEITERRPKDSPQECRKLPD